ncbi:MAG: (deoxy)nucleoside triphosphate pyrophosphohydrolase [Desulfobacteraceae bacterium]|nr:MAG: (deoxy)nucleoside triphosphate pyrophosphohydrolase [Desulfobacteraceae bacterium]
MKENKREHFVSVAAGLIWEKGKVLIAKRPGGSFMAGYWEFPGGKKEAGETLDQCLKRELFEELRITVRVGDVFMEAAHEYPSEAVYLTTMFCTIVSGEPMPVGSEEIKWVTPDELRHYKMCPPDLETVNAILSNSGGLKNAL